MERLCPRIGDGVMAVRDVVQAAAGVGGDDNLYVEDVFSTYLYTGTGSTQTITNGIDLDGEGGLVWFKNRGTGDIHALFDSERPLTNYLRTNGPNPESTATTNLAFNSNGFSLNNNFGFDNTSSNNYVSWTFRKSPKFFDVVTWTGDGVDGRLIPHNLDAVPGFVIVKRTDTTSNWTTSNIFSGVLLLNSTGPQATGLNPAGLAGGYIDTRTSTTFSVVGYSGSLSTVNETSGTYVAYVFANNAGGFGDDGTESIIKCGSWNGTSGASSPIVNLGWEPQWILVKRFTGGNGEWLLFDNMRGMPVGGIDKTIRVEVSTAEESAADFLSPTATGFIVDPTLNQYINESGSYIYIAIRRPMKTPESGTEVFAIDTAGGTAPNPPLYNAGFPVDMAIFALELSTSFDNRLHTRLLGETSLATNSTRAEAAATEGDFDYQDGWNSDVFTNATYISWMFRRAPGFFDVVAYTGTGSATTVAHNLGVAPELIIAKRRSGAIAHWPVYSKSLNGGVNPAMYYIYLSMSDGTSESPSAWNDTAPTSSVFTVGTAGNINASGAPYVAYLFASLPGISKVSSYTGTGADLNVDCGFSAGARFILIKRTDPASTGDWYVWDSLRGISAGNDPYLLLNSTAAEVTSTDYIDPLASGFTVTSSAPAALNASGGNYIFLAIA